MDSLKNMDLMRLMKECDTQEECRAILEELRWPDGVKCPRCQSDKISRIRKRFQYDCDSCRYQFSVTSGTIFHDSHLPLPKWFAAVYLMCESRRECRLSRLSASFRLAIRQLGISVTASEKR